MEIGSSADELDRLADMIEAGYGDVVAGVKAVSRLGRLTSEEDRVRLLREKAAALRGRSYDVGVGRRAG